MKSETFSDLFDKQLNTNRTYKISGRENIKIAEDLN
jgi:hypothetical protein